MKARAASKKCRLGSQETRRKKKETTCPSFFSWLPFTARQLAFQPKRLSLGIPHSTFHAERFWTGTRNVQHSACCGSPLVRRAVVRRPVVRRVSAMKSRLVASPIGGMAYATTSSARAAHVSTILVTDPDPDPVTVPVPVPVTEHGTRSRSRSRNPGEGFGLRVSVTVGQTE